MCISQHPPNTPRVRFSIHTYVIRCVHHNSDNQPIVLHVAHHGLCIPSFRDLAFRNATTTGSYLAITPPATTTTTTGTQRSASFSVLAARNVLSSKRMMATRLDELPSALPPPPPGQEPRTQKEKRAIYVAWALLAVEACLSFFLFVQGDGRVSKYIDFECIDGAGPQRVSGAEFFKLANIVGSQLVLWQRGFQIELPDNAFARLATMGPYANKAAMNEGRLISTVTQKFGFVGGSAYLFVFFVAMPFYAMVYIMYPITMNITAVCAIGDTWIILPAFVTFMGVCDILKRWQQQYVDWSSAAIYFTTFDDILISIFSTAANSVQSGLTVGLLFAVLPTYEIVYKIVTECF